MIWYTRLSFIIQLCLYRNWSDTLKRHSWFNSVCMLTQSLIWYANAIHNTTLVYAFKEIISNESMMSLNMRRRIVIESTFSSPIPSDSCLYALIIQGIFNGLYCIYFVVCYVCRIYVFVDLVFVLQIRNTKSQIKYTI